MSIQKKYMKEFLIFLYEYMIDFLIVSFATPSVLGDTVRLIPTENMTPATVYKVSKTSPVINTLVYKDKTTAKTIDTNKYINNFFITATNVLILKSKLRKSSCRILT